MKLQWNYERAFLTRQAASKVKIKSHKRQEKQFWKERVMSGDLL